MAAQRRRRLRSQLPPCYHEGYLDKSSPNEKVSHKLWTALCGNTLFFFNGAKDADYADMLELRGFISVTDDDSRGTDLKAVSFNLSMKDGDVKFMAPSLEARELWKGYIYAVAKLEEPSSLNLLPGQLHVIREVIDKEKRRCKPPPLPPGPIPSQYIPLHADMPSCYHRVSRTEAETLLERYQANGNFLLRPGKSGSSFAITTYQDLNGPVFRNYRVSRKPDGGFAIEVENPIACATLNDVVNYMIEMTSGILRPLILDDIYDHTITYIQSNNESGERNVQSASTDRNTAAPIPAPKPGPLTDRKASLDASRFEDLLYLNDTHKKALLPKIPSSPTLSEGQSITGLGTPEERSTARPPTPPPKIAKKPLLPKTPSFQSALQPEGPYCRPTAADILEPSQPVPAPRSVKTEENFATAFTAELEDRLEVLRVRQALRTQKINPLPM